jgi:alpha-galactosidase
MDRLVNSYQLDWIKIDYNNDVEDRFDSPSPDQRGAMHYGHVTSYYRWLDEVRSKHPRLIVENCASGGMRFDLGIIGHTHTTWLSDITPAKPSLQLAYGSTFEFTPAVCNHWMVGDKDNGEINFASPRGWWEFMLRVPMNGQFGISSRVLDWPEELKQTARAEVARYKRIREVIAEADTYHLTPSPDHDQPEGWMGLQYVAPAKGRSVLNAYRLGNSQPERAFQLRGLDPQRSYRITINGESGGSKTGAELSREGLSIRLPEEWRAAVVELESTP